MPPLWLVFCVYLEDMQPAILIIGEEQPPKCLAGLSAFFQVHQANSLERALLMLNANRFSLVLVQQSNPHQNSRTFDALRHHHSGVPALRIAPNINPPSHCPTVDLVDQAGKTLLSQLAGSIAHDITNSISFVISNLRTLCIYHDDLVAALPSPTPHSLRAVTDDLAPLVEESIEGVTRIQAIAKELRAFTKNEESSRENLDLHDLLEGAIRYTAPEFHHCVSLTRHYAAKSRAIVSPTRMRQCLAHLILSVTRAHLASNSRHEVVIETCNDSSEIEISLISTEGFDRQLIENHWVPFFSQQNTEVDNQILFLAAAKSIAHHHCGSLRLGPSWPDHLRLTLRLPSADRS